MHAAWMITDKKSRLSTDTLLLRHGATEFLTSPPSPSTSDPPTAPQISLIIACIIGVIAYRLAVYAAFASIMKDSPTNNLHMVGSLITPQLATSVTASCINFVIIMILNLMYERVAIWITDMGEGDD